MVANILDSLDKEMVSNCLIISQVYTRFDFYKKNYPTATVLRYLNYNIVKDYLNSGEPGVIVLDDCSKNIISHDIVADLFFNSRHYKKMLISTIQYPLRLPPAYRANIDYVFLFAVSSGNEQERLYKHWAGIFPDLNTFKQNLHMLTKNYGSMVIKKSGKETNIHDKVFWYRFKLKKN